MCLRLVRLFMKVAVIQMSPVFLDKKASWQKLKALILEAISEGASVITWAETLLPGYPGSNVSAHVITLAPSLIASRISALSFCHDAFLSRNTGDICMTATFINSLTRRKHIDLM